MTKTSNFHHSQDYSLLTITIKYHEFGHLYRAVPIFHTYTPLPITTSLKYAYPGFRWAAYRPCCMQGINSCRVYPCTTLGSRETIVDNMPCRRPYAFEPTTLWLWVESTNHYSTVLLFPSIFIRFLHVGCIANLIINDRFWKFRFQNIMSIMSASVLDMYNHDNILMYWGASRFKFVAYLYMPEGKRNLWKIFTWLYYLYIRLGGSTRV